MTRRAAKPLVRRARADEDVDEAIDYFLVESPASALRIVDTLEAAYKHIQRAPGAGSPRYAHELNLPGLRSWPCKRYPYLVFYVERADSIDVWRVLHTRRDIPRWLHDGAR